MSIDFFDQGGNPMVKHTISLGFKFCAEKRAKGYWNSWTRFLLVIRFITTTSCKWSFSWLFSRCAHHFHHQVLWEAPNHVGRQHRLVRSRSILHNFRRLIRSLRILGRSSCVPPNLVYKKTADIFFALLRHK